MKDFRYRGWLNAYENKYECLICGGFYLARSVKDLRKWHKHEQGKDID